MNEPRTSKPRRMLMTADTVGGVWDYALELTRALGAYDIAVALATMGAPLTPAQWREAAGVANLAICESRYKLEWRDEPWEDVTRAGDWLLQLEEQFQPDLIHLNGYAHGALPWRAPAMIAGHSCVLSWWRAVKNEAAPESWARYQQAVARGLAAVGLVVAPSQVMLEALNEHYGPLPAARVIHNGRAARSFLPHAKEPLIFAAGRLWDEGKNIAALRRIAPELPWPVFIAGAEKQAGGGNVSLGKCFWLGRLASEEIAAWLGRAALYVLPARYEPFGLSALEAALAGCALVLGDIPSLRELWGDAAIFVPPENDDALKTVIHELIEVAAWREEQAARARQRAWQFTPQRMAAAYLAAYSTLVRKEANFKGEARACAS